jgi:hypothetical protein
MRVLRTPSRVTRQASFRSIHELCRGMFDSCSTPRPGWSENPLIRADQPRKGRPEIAIREQAAGQLARARRYCLIISGAARADTVSCFGCFGKRSRRSRLSGKSLTTSHYIMHQNIRCIHQNRNGNLCRVDENTRTFVGGHDGTFGARYTSASSSTSYNNFALPGQTRNEGANSQTEHDAQGTTTHKTKLRNCTIQCFAPLRAVTLRYDPVNPSADAFHYTGSSKRRTGFQHCHA